ncbi:hypothetical protein Pen02_81760 [Plantactinospora endophytica]|uniref:Uncharacterized protein n=1 Tax=Plantactinospora endophytica TaxID=673535 RepID=A0ABQ4EEV5_9ACTN|nr:hypothetical protein Pen02_81760 [Plantactinospora endophytica]
MRRTTVEQLPWDDGQTRAQRHISFSAALFSGLWIERCLRTDTPGVVPGEEGDVMTATLNNVTPRKAKADPSAEAKAAAELVSAHGLRCRARYARRTHVPGRSAASAPSAAC